MTHLRTLGMIFIGAMIAGCCGSSDSTDPIVPAPVVTPPVAQPPVGQPPVAQPPVGAPMKQPPAVPVKQGLPAGGNTLTVGMPTGGLFTNALPTDTSGKPFIDYTLTVATPGNYRIDLMSGNTSQYDPYIILLQGMNEIGRDDDGGDQSLQSRLTQMLQPGVYTVRVTKFGTGQISMPTPFTLSVTQS